MLWWFIGLWVCSPVLLPVFWLLGRLHQTLGRPPEAVSPAARQGGVASDD
jgi:hypothetical protein